ncbi:MAG TPA: hypothetical protein VMW54_06070 [Terriglobia bacterium]|nr:hypothetical protein [Terriglobia bacterium]
MHSAHVPVGMVIVGVTVGFFGLRYFTRRKQDRFRSWGWAGLGVLFLAEFFLLLGAHWISIYFTPLCWTAYILIIDAAVSCLKGRSRLADSPRKLFILALASVPLWLIFEAYNLRMQNWIYVGLPANTFLRNLGYTWAFATIWPAIFETADFVEALGYFGKPISPHRPFARGSRVGFIVLGLLFLTVPVLVPAGLGRYLFALVWVGFVLLLEPLNYRWGGRSLLREWERGKASTFWSFLVSGLVCGVLWEFWNYWAAAKWFYIFPILQGWKIFEMPLPGYFGFPAFALECFVMYESLNVAASRLWGFRQDKRMSEQYPSS